MRNLLLFITLLATVPSYAQEIIELHSGKKITGTVLRIDDFSITYSREGQRVERVLSKHAVSTIAYSNGDEEHVSEKIVVESDDDWENVVLLLDPNETMGLKEGGEIKGSTSFIANFHTGTSSERKAEKKLKKAAAALGCPFVMLTSDKEKLQTNQTVKRGIAYKY